MKTEVQIERAMERLLNGTPELTDGRLTKRNLALEAQVSEATLYRAKRLLNQWEEQVGQNVSDRGKRSVRDLKAEISNLKAQNRRVTEQLTEAKSQLQAALTLLAEYDATLMAMNKNKIVYLNSTPLS